jgi:hypothetical protein
LIKVFILPFLLSSARALPGKQAYKRFASIGER